MDKILFKNLYTEVALSVDSSLLMDSFPEEYIGFSISIKTRAGDKYKIAKRKITNSRDIVETAIYQALDTALLIASKTYVSAIPYEEIVEIGAEATKGYER